MAKSDVKKELLSRLKAKNTEKENRMIYISSEIWAELVAWGEKQKPPQKPSRILEELARIFLEHNT